jgi:hypothetical protein
LNDKTNEITHNYRLFHEKIPYEGQPSEVEQIAILCHFPAREFSFGSLSSQRHSYDVAAEMSFRQHRDNITKISFSVRVLCSL